MPERFIVPRDEDAELPEHLISVSCDWLERNGFGVSGWLSIYFVPASETSSGYEFVHDPDLRSPAEVGGGLLLFGTEEVCFPEEEVLNAYLTPDEKAGLGYLPKDGYVALEPGYTRMARAGCPVYRPDVAAVLGGWHISWPDGPPRLPHLQEINDRCDRAGGPGCLDPAETFPIEPYRLALWTLKDAEPWIEVLVGPDGDLHLETHVT